MKFCVIDVGSNSVRLMLSEGNKTIYKKVKITRLAENLGKERFLCSKAVDRTISVIKELYYEAVEEKPENIYIFATAAVRQAKNNLEFCDLVKKETGLTVDVVSGEIEAMLGVKGALRGNFGGLIDIGGASTEVALISANRRYFKSFPIGAGTLTDKMKDIDANVVLEEVFFDLPLDLGNAFYGIGGTVTSVSAIIQELSVYNADLVDGYFIDKNKLFLLKEKLSKMTVDEISLMKGVQKGREGVIYAGVCILIYLIDKLNLSGITVSESDNLEGYLQYIRGENE